MVIFVDTSDGTGNGEISSPRFTPMRIVQLGLKLSFRSEGTSSDITSRDDESAATNQAPRTKMATRA
jgi:hypothetical protein